MTRGSTSCVVLLVSGTLLACDGMSAEALDPGTDPGAVQLADSGAVQVADSGAGDLVHSGSVTFTIRNNTGVPLYLPGGMFGRWLEIGFRGYSLWPANSVRDNALCDADQLDLGDLPPPGGDVPIDGEHSYEWRANAFIGAEPIPGVGEEYYCATTGRVPLGEHQFLICAREANIACSTSGIEPYPPRLICTSMVAQVEAGHTTAEFSFDSDEFPTENCAQGEEIPN